MGVSNPVSRNLKTEFPAIPSQKVANPASRKSPAGPLQTLTHEEETEEDANEHSTYTPQIDLDNIPSDRVIMDSVGMVDLKGSTVNSTDQITSAT